MAPYLYDGSVGLRVGGGDAVDGLAWLALVIDGRLCLRRCWGCSILLCWLGLHSYCLLSSGVPESGVTLLALYLRGRLGRYREDSYPCVLGCYSWLGVLLGVASGEVGGGDVLRDTRDWSGLGSGGWRGQSEFGDMTLGRSLFIVQGGLNRRGRQQYFACIGVAGIHKGLDGITRRVGDEARAGGIGQRRVVSHSLELLLLLLLKLLLFLGFPLSNLLLKQLSAFLCG